MGCAEGRNASCGTLGIKDFTLRSELSSVTVTVETLVSLLEKVLTPALSLSRLSEALWLKAPLLSHDLGHTHSVISCKVWC